LTFYRLLLRVFPRQFRERFGDDMTATFEARRRDARSRGAWATIALWIRTVMDMTRHGSGERWQFVSEFVQDVRFAVRLFRRRPGFSATAVITLALGIGVNIATFSVVNAVLIRPLPFPAANQLVRVAESSIDEPRPSAFNPANFLDVKRQTKEAFSSIAAYRRIFAVTLTSAGAEAVHVKAVIVQPEFFDVLGVPVALGRPITQADVDAKSRSVVISGPFWRARLGADPGVIGRPIELDGQSWTVVGVMPDGHEFPANNEVWETLAFTPADLASRNDWNLTVIGRMRPGITLDAANAAVKLAMDVVGRTSPGPMPRTAVVLDQQGDLTSTVRGSVLFIQGVAALVLLIACANLANLLLAAATVRHHEFSIRASIGAGRGRLVRQLLAESFVIAAAGATSGAVLAALLVPLLVAAFPGYLPGRELVAVRWPELAVAVVAAFATSLVFGILPAITASRSAGAAARQAENRVGPTRFASLTRNALVAAEVTITLALVAGSLLLIRSFAALTSQEVGFSSQNVTTASLELPSGRFPTDADRRRVFETLLDRLTAEPDIESVATTFPLAFDGASMGSKQRWDPALNMTTPLSFERHYVSPGYLDVMAVPLIRGRFFSTDDRDGSPPVVVVNEAFARKYGTTRDVIGMRFVTSDDKPMTTIVGVVADTRTNFWRPTPSDVMFPLSQTGLGMGSFVIRSRSSADAIGRRFRDILSATFPFVPVDEIAPLSDVIHSSVSVQRFNMALLAGLAVLALVLSVVGIYGVMAYVVSQRRREMAIRMALGAGAAQVRSLSVRQGLAPIVIGIAAGLVGAWFFTTLLKKELFQIQPHDPWTLIAATLLFFLVGLAACWLPARRSGHVNPVEALKAD
jgi:predicted permease